MNELKKIKLKISEKREFIIELKVSKNGKNVSIWQIVCSKV